MPLRTCIRQPHPCACLRLRIYNEAQGTSCTSCTHACTHAWCRAGNARLRFARDARLAEVVSLLDSSQPLVLALGLHEGDPEAGAKQQAQLLQASLRTMALPMGRGAVVIGTGR